jgi:dinuclear metal center YbgI/SA1388 family protein
MRDLLQIESFSEADSAYNGLQVDRTRQEIEKIAFAVDASMESFRRAVEVGADLLFVHHGLLWGEFGPMTGGFYCRIRFLMEKDLGLYAAHLPLDSHPELGNNAALANTLNLEKVEPFGVYKGIKIGCKGRFSEPLTIEEIDRMLGEGENSVILPFGPETISNVGIVSGRSPETVGEAAADGLDLFISGEPSHTIYHECLESGISAVFAGHYRTETGGVRNLAEHIGENTDLETVWIEIPTGL